MQNLGDGGFVLQPIGALAQGDSKLEVIRGDVRDSVAVMHRANKTVVAWSPYQPDGGIAPAGTMLAVAPPLTPNVVDDISSARLPGWTADGLVLTGMTTGNSSVLSTFPLLAHGQKVRLDYPSPSGVPWVTVRGFRNYVMAAHASSPWYKSNALRFDADGGLVETSGNLASLLWSEAESVSLTGNPNGDFVVHDGYPDTISLYAGALVPGFPTPSDPVKNIKPADAGLLQAGKSFAVGDYQFATTMFHLNPTGVLRQLNDFTLVGQDYLATSVARPDLADAGYLHVLVSDMNFDSKNDLVLLEQFEGKIRIDFTQ
jgi:hypothetical protein